ncbi:MAG TPA: TIR domain-containing protein, partial [Blastocatellia bacterium]|nr:TIR domain-containing protein [Blastocatellia bacterium]
MSTQKETSPPNTTYDVFLSYSRRDIEFVKLLEKELNDYLPLEGQHRLSVFRDEGKITGNEYYRSIERALRHSRKLILVATPNSYKSQFVNDEVRDFIRMKGARNVFVILLGGIPNNEVQPGQEDLKAFPDVLCEVMRMPLAVDYRGFDPTQNKLTAGRHQNDWRRILAHLYDDGLASATKESWDIFLSYASADTAFAAHLEKELEKYVPPKDLALAHHLPHHRLKVFRDEDDATKDDFEAIRRALESSPQMLLLCSPDARADQRVRAQVAQFAGLHGADRIIRVLVAGEPVPDAADSAFPIELCQWIKEPSYTDYRGFRPGKDKVSNGAYSGHWATLLATYFQVKREDLEQRERKRRTRNRQLIGGLTTTVILLLSAALAWALASRQLAVKAQAGEAAQRKDAETQRNVAQGALKQEELARKEADERRLEAEAAKTEEARQRGLAEDSAIEANEQRLLAEEQQLEAVRQRNVAVAERQQAESRLYVVRGLLAQTAMDQQNYARANEFLEASIPPPSTPAKDDLRSFDWFYRWRLLHDEKGTLKGHSDSVWSVAFSPDGRMLASGSWDGSAKLWEVASGQEKATLTGYGYSVESVVFSPDGRTLASGSGDNRIRTITLWDVASGQWKATLQGHADSISSVAFSPDGRTLASGSRDKMIKLWEVASGREKATFKGHTFSVSPVAFSPDGRTLASSDDKMIKLWDVASG